MKPIASHFILRVIGVFCVFQTSFVWADNTPGENPVAASFRKHFQDADVNKDGFVTRDELAAEIAKDGNCSPEVVGKIVDSMMRDLDADKDGKLSAAEIAESARRAGEHADFMTDVHSAQKITSALKEYKSKHDGKFPAELSELLKLNLVEEAALTCLLKGGENKPWGYQSEKNGDVDGRAVILYSPGPVDSDGQGVVGLETGDVIGLNVDGLALDKLTGFKARVYSDHYKSEQAKKTKP